jgi:GWxTD domain-containing protein
MTRYLSFFLLLVSFSVYSQALRDINYDYRYNPGAPVSLELNTVRSDSNFVVLYKLTAKDTADFADRYSLTWEGRDMLSDREGRDVEVKSRLYQRIRGGVEGIVSLGIDSAPKYLVARVTHHSANRAWLFYIPLDKDYPVNNFLVRNGSPVTESFIRPTDKVTLGLGSGQWTVFYYSEDFPAGAPAFSEAQSRVPALMSVDSVYTINTGEPLQFPSTGLYLIQKDTSSVEGLAFRVEDDYPQYAKLASLPDPLVYITTRNEHERLVAARGNKRAFDRIILSITQDTERARILMRNYFRRVELANRYFSSYKEGWKTDRGMVFIIFGLPDEVYLFDDREVWEYKNNRLSESFVFVRSGSIFDPGNKVLIRQRKKESSWYEVVDLWRNARF